MWGFNMKITFQGFKLMNDKGEIKMSSDNFVLTELELKDFLKFLRKHSKREAELLKEVQGDENGK
jgi:hypothetical protein